MRGASPGDLYIFVIGRRRTACSSATAPTSIAACRSSMATAALGGSIEVPTIDGGRAKVNVPAGTQTGHQFRLKNKGMSVLRSAARGDMYIQAIVETPVNLTKRQQELLREFEKEGEDGKTNPGERGLLRPGEGVLRGSAGIAAGVTPGSA